MKGNGIIAIYLAAGRSMRMGVDKLSLPLGTHTIGNSALEEALKSSVHYIIVVTRTEDSLDWIDSNLSRIPIKNKWSHITCSDANKGQAHSLQCGLRAAMRMKPKGIMILLGDQPFLSIEIINELVLKYVELNYEKKDFPFIAAGFQGIPRPPIIFSPKSFPELLKLKGDEGARQLFQRQKLEDGLLIEYSNVRDFLDIDTMKDYEGLKGAVTSHD
ncbi:NTP transferase domain-containing protein [Metabacillus herbersteinensis]|uniref:NTP transferase domain-containing protein n=1 Tax=Metabacillus herbersteinensis TaxID=283816 RepID=A0ABV6GGH7_9BACI